MSLAQAISYDLRYDRPMVEHHPITTGRYILATNTVDEMCNTINRWIINRIPGGIIYGRQRLGKTYAIRYAVHELAALHQNIPVFVTNCKKYRILNESAFFEDLSGDFGIGILSGKANTKRNRICAYLIEKAKDSGTNRLVILFDDAQRLTELSYEWLMDIYNELENQGITMTAILIGQEELEHQRSALIAQKKRQVIGRFMVHMHKFEGLQTKEDIVTCLSAYDDHTEAPSGSGWSFTRYYLPEPFENGFRLKNCANDIYEAFTSIRNEHGIIGQLEIPMQFFTLTIEYFLKEFGCEGLDHKQFGTDHWKTAIENSGYIDAELCNNMWEKLNKRGSK